jgi:hypothetical protein
MRLHARVSKDGGGRKTAPTLGGLHGSRRAACESLLTMRPSEASFHLTPSRQSP